MLVHVLIVFFLFGAAVAVLQTFAAIVPPYLPGDSWIWVSASSLVTLLLLLFARSLDSIVSLSVYALIFLFAFGCLALDQAVENAHSLAGLPLWPSSGQSLLAATSILVFAYVCHFQVITIFQGLQEPRRHLWLQSLTASMGISGAFYSVVGICGLLANPGTAGNMLVDLLGSTLSKVVTFGLALGFAITVPLISWEGVRSFRALLCCESLARVCRSGGLESSETVDSNDDVSSGSSSSSEADGSTAACQIGSEGTTSSFVAACCIWMTSVTLIAVYYKDVGKVISVTGAISGTPIMFVLPPLMFVSVINSENQGARVTLPDCTSLVTSRGIYGRWFAYATVALGIALTVACTYSSLMA
ncbi:unnamed protein product [Polarella glacialis]|uniref:Amino acid transporter transmembrane domain-containing protein n=1 Tax=Polarella glacialis TaxID=89957 RepID=A0A813EVT6_POLGL|nr:unnamed protein product [Polarella glacialis]